MWISEQKLRELVTQIVSSQLSLQKVNQEPRALLDVKIIKVFKTQKELYYGANLPKYRKVIYTLVEWPDGTRTRHEGVFGNEGDTFKMEKPAAGTR